MKSNLLRFVLLVILAQALAACGAVATPTPAPVPTNTAVPAPTVVPTATPIDLATIAQNFYLAINAGDIEAAMALVANDVTCRGECYFTGKDLFKAYIMAGINRGDRIELSDLKAEGDKVTYSWKAYSQAGFFQASGQESLQFREGLIILMDSVAQ
jgi:hypothetical protein